MQNPDLSLDNCVKCSDCNAACPVMQVYPTFPGPKVLGPDTERFRREGVESDTDWVEYCMGCHRCDLACPHSVLVSQLITKGKAQHQETGPRALRDYWLARPSSVGKLSSIAPGLTNPLMHLKPSRLAISALAQITPRRTLPAYSARPLSAADGVATAGRKALLFPGCFIRYNQPDLGRKVIGLLRLSGFSVEVTPDICCGTPAGANCDDAERMDCIQKNVQAMSQPVQAGACVVTACTSCGYALKSEYAHVPSNGNGFASAAEKISSNTYDLGELLCDLLDGEGLHTDFRETPMRLAYHAPCHLKAQGIGRPWLRLLRTVPGIEIEEMKADCCGMAGTFGFKKEKYQISMDIGSELFERIKAHNPDAVV